MGNDHPVKTRCWLRFLASKGCTYLRTKSSHDMYKCPNCLQDIVFRGREKDVPAMHVRTNLRTMGIPYRESLEWKKENC